MKLTADYYQHDDVVAIARDLVGKVLCTNIAGKSCKGIITETEAYNGRTDKASHAYDGRRTKRTEVMYAAGGRSYVYLCYGIHNLFNIVTNKEGLADAVLIRGLEPLEGVAEMIQRRSPLKDERNISSGPGTLTIAMGIDREQNNLDLQGDIIWLEDHKLTYAIDQSARIGIDYAGEDAKLPWRFKKR